LKYIDLEGIIATGNSSFLKKLPRFIIRIIQWLIMEDEMNRILAKYPGVVGFEFLEVILKEFNITLEIEGKENLPENGRCFFVANHPFGVIDGLILTHTISGKYGTLKAIGNEAFAFLPNLRPFIVAVDVFKPNSKEYIAILEQFFDSAEPITHFAAGEVSRIYNWKIQDCKWQKSFVTKSVSKNRPVVPCYFYGRNSLFFYSISILRKLMGIKLIIEFVLLPREMFRKRNKTIRFKIGKPILPQRFDKSHNAWEWAQLVREHVYQMGKTSGIHSF
jgi:putative hemolysin